MEMVRAVFLAALSLLLVPGLACAGKIELEIVYPNDGASFSMDGSTDFTVRVKNTNESWGDIDGVSIGLTGSDSVSVSSDSVSIGVNDTADIDVTINGAIWEKTRVRLETVASHPEHRIYEDGISIILVPPDFDLKIIYPQGGMNLVDFEEGGGLEFKVVVENSGEGDLYGVELTLEPDVFLDCQISGGDKKDIGVGGRAEFNVRCDNISTGKELDLSVRDEHRAAFDMETLEFSLVPGFDYPENGSSVNQSSPGEGNDSIDQTEDGPPPANMSNDTDSTGGGAVQPDYAEGGGIAHAEPKSGISGTEGIIVSLVMICAPLAILIIYAWMAMFRKGKPPAKEEAIERGQHE